MPTDVLSRDASELAERFDVAVDAIARLTGYPYGERHVRWIGRVRVNLPELCAFDSVNPISDFGYLGPPSSAPLAAAWQAKVAPLPSAESRMAMRSTGSAAHIALERAREQANLNAFIGLADGSVIDVAVNTIERRVRRGEALALAGVPVAIKDLMPVSGFVQTNGTFAPCVGRPAAEDAPAVARLRDAGAIVVGTTNLHELAYGITSDNPHYGRVVNPRHPAHTPGGSSGGSAAAVAAGVVGIAIERMREDGARVLEIDVAGVESSAALQFVTLCSEATDQHWQRLLAKPETLGADVRVRLEIGQFLPAIWYVRAQRARADLAVSFTRAMSEVDVLVTPTLRIAPPYVNAGAPMLGGRDVPLHTAMTSLTMPFNSPECPRSHFRVVRAITVRRSECRSSAGGATTGASSIRVRASKH